MRWLVAPPALPNPARLPEKQRQPCPRLELLGRIRIPFSSPDQHKGCTERQECIAQAGLCQASQLPSLLTTHSPWSCIYRDEEGKGRKHSTSCWLLRLLGAWLPEHIRLGKHLLNLAKAQRANFSPAELQAATFKGVFPQKTRGPHPNHPTLRASATKNGLGKGSAVRSRRSPGQMNQMLLLLGWVVLARRGLLFERQQLNMHVHVVFLTCSLIARGFSVV